MVWHSSDRKRRNLCVLWIILTLLQQFNLILSQNIQLMKASSSSENLGTSHNDEARHDTFDINSYVDISLSQFESKHDIEKRDIREKWSKMKIKQAIVTAGDKLHVLGTHSFANNLSLPCDIEEHQHVWKQWQENPLSYPFYMTSHAILAHIQNCTHLIDVYVEEMYMSFDEEEILETIEMFESLDIEGYVNELLHPTHNDDENESDAIEPESEEHEMFKEIQSIIATNIVRVDELSEVLYSLNNTQQSRSYGNMDEELDNIIAEFDIVSEIYNEPANRRKRDVAEEEHAHENTKNRFPMRNKQLHIHDAVMKRGKEEIRIRNEYIWLNIQRKQIKLHKQGNPISQHRFGDDGSGKLALANRVKRQTSGANIVFIKNENFPCKLLSFDSEQLSFQTFSERDIYKQLWIWDQGFLQHFESGKLLQVVDSIGTLRLYQNASSEFKFDQGKLLHVHNGCYIRASINEITKQLELICDIHDNNQTWAFVMMEDATQAVSWVSCLFIIQDKFSCHVVTTNSSNMTEVYSEPISEEDISNQLWYWDGDFIKNSLTHTYLSVGDENDEQHTVTLLQKDQSFFQRWGLNNDTLYPFGVSNFTLHTPFMYTGYINSTANSSLHLSIHYVNQSDSTECVNTKDLFVIKNTAINCKVLCEFSEIRAPSLWLRIMGPSFLFAAGAVVGYIVYKMLRHSERKEQLTACISSVIFGVLLSGTALTLIELFGVFDSAINGVQFEQFNNNRLCLWNAYKGKIQNAETDKFLYVEKTDENDGYNAVVVRGSGEMTVGLQDGKVEFPFACSDYGFVFKTDGGLQINCKAGNVGKWHTVHVDDSLSFAQSVLCLYMLRPLVQNSCKVLSVTSIDTNSTLSTAMPSNEKIYNQLWYIDGEYIRSIGSDIALDGLYSDVQGKYDWLEFGADSSSIESILDCSINLFFLKDPNECEVLTIGDDGNPYFHHYDFDYLTRQLWFWRDSYLINVATENYLTVPHIAENAQRTNVTRWRKDHSKLRSVETGCAISRSFLDKNMTFCSDMDDEIEWNFVKFDRESNYLESVLCTFFIQSLVSPCGYLTANIDHQSVFVAPMTSDVIDSQYWYISGKHLIHLNSGARLEVDMKNKLIVNASNSTPNEIQNNWSFQDNEIISINGLKLTNVDNKVRIEVTNDNFLENSTKWQLIESETAFSDPNKLNCRSLERQYFFIKSDNDPCKLLTAHGFENDVSLDIFNEEQVGTQLWFFENGKIFNFEQGNVLMVNTNSTYLELSRENAGELRVDLGTALYYESLQGFHRDGSVIFLPFDNDPGCFLTWNGHRLTCATSGSTSPLWSFVSYDDGLEDISLIMCLFLMESQQFPGQFMTGYGESMALKARPVVEELMADQIFFWNDNHIIHRKSKLLLTVGSPLEGQYLSLEKKSAKMQTWFKNLTSFVPHSDRKTSIGIDTKNDGLIVLKPLVSQWQDTWIETYLNKNDELPNEPHDLNNEQLFFLQSISHPCKVLTGDTLGEEPLFKVFSKTQMAKYLWLYIDKQLVNVESGLALMLDQTGKHTYTTQMWHSYKFANRQRWDNTSRGIIPELAGDCPLHSLSQDSEISVSPSCNSKVGDIRFVAFDENAEFIEKVTCLFFIKNTMKPCELLTAIDSTNVRPRVVHVDLIENHLWYWSGRYIANAKEDQFLTLNAATYEVYLSSSQITEWTYSYLSFKTVDNSNMQLSLAISAENGVVVAQPLFNDNAKQSQWIMVDRNKGIENADLLSCPSSSSDQTMYIIRSEYDKCPILASTDQATVSTFKEITEDNIRHTVWLLNNGQIINGNSMALTRQNSQRVMLEHTSTFEVSQKWIWGDKLIKSDQPESTFYLSYTGSGVALSKQSNSDKQKWKIFSVKDLQDDDKLLRCSRCYNKDEEKAAEVISWFPVIGWLYNIGRGIAYSVKKCPKVAMWAFIEGFVDVAMDLLTVVSLGTAAGIAVGVKTAFKLGFKAGLKIAMKAMASMIKNAVKKLAKNLLKNATKLLKGGFKASLKKQLTLSKLKLKSLISKIKKFPRNFKQLTVTKINDMKTIVKKAFKSTTKIFTRSKSAWKGHIQQMSTSLLSRFKNMPKLMRKQFSKAAKVTKKELKDLGNRLAAKGERAIKKAKVTKTSRRRLRCRRAPGCKYNPGDDINKRLKQLDINLPNSVLTPDEASMKLWNKIQGKIDKPGQAAAAGIKRNGDVDNIITSHIDDLRVNNAKPKYQDGADVIDDQFKKNDIMHTEEDLLNRLDEVVATTCTKNKPCDVMLYSNLSPCNNRLPPQAIPCMQNIVNTCKRWFQEFATKCKVAFKQYYDDGLDTLSTEWDDYFMKQFGGKPNKKISESIEQAANQNKDMIYSYVNGNREIFVKNTKDVLNKELSKAKLLQGKGNAVIEETKQRLVSVIDSAYKSTNDLQTFWRSFFNAAKEGVDKKVFNNVQGKLTRNLVVNIRTKLNEISRQKGTIKSIQDAGGFQNSYINFFQV